MRIREIKQVNDGRQLKAYGDHIYKWIITTNGRVDEAELTEFCKKYLEHAPLQRDEYLEKYRSNLPFNEHMQVVCGGWYKLTQKGVCEWEYLVQREYID